MATAKAYNNRYPVQSPTLSPSSNFLLSDKFLHISQKEVGTNQATRNLRKKQLDKVGYPKDVLLSQRTLSKK